MMEKYRPNFESLTPEEASLVATTVLRKLGLEETPPESGLEVFEMCSSHGLDQAGVVMAMARDATATGVSALEKLVGHPIKRDAPQAASGKPRAQRGPRPVLRDDRVIRLLAETNPKKKGSKAHDRFELYKDGMTVQEFRKAGGTSDDVKWDAERGFIRVDDPAPKTEESNIGE